MTATLPKTKRPDKAPAAQARKRKHPKAPTDFTIEVDWSRRDAFLKLSIEERERRIQGFIDYFAPAFADYSSDDFRADQRREAERD
jgi:hypothetical protein